MCRLFIAACNGKIVTLLSVMILCQSNGDCTGNLLHNGFMVYLKSSIDRSLILVLEICEILLLYGHFKHASFHSMCLYSVWHNFRVLDCLSLITNHFTT